MLRTRAFYLLAAGVVMLLGLGSRRYGEQLPPFVAQFSGDTLWALMLFLLVSMLLAEKPMSLRISLSFVLAFLIEVSQLYPAPWIDSVRATTLGGLVLGFGFLWTDLICYTVGISVGAIADWGVVRAATSDRPSITSN